MWGRHPDMGRWGHLCFMRPLAAEVHVSESRCLSVPHHGLRLRTQHAGWTSQTGCSGRELTFVAAGSCGHPSVGRVIAVDLISTIRQNRGGVLKTAACVELKSRGGDARPGTGGAR